MANSPLFAEFGLAITRGILHALWQATAAVVMYCAAKPMLRSARMRYLLALGLLTTTTAAFFVSMGTTPEPQPASDAMLEAFAWPVPPSASSWPLTIALAWVVGVTFMLGRFLGGWVWLQVAVLGTATELTGALGELFAKLCSQMGLAGRARLLASPRVASPMLTGFFRPVVLLPLSMATGMPGDAVYAALVHELSHLRHLDHLAVWIHAATETVLFFHPGIWWLSREARCQREYRCDDDAVEFLGNRMTYARALLAMEQRRTFDNLPTSAMNGGDLMSRVSRLFGVTSATKSRNAAGIALAMAMVAGLAGYNASCGEAHLEPVEAVSQEASSLGIAWAPPAVLRWEHELTTAAARHGVSAATLALLMLVESGGDQDAVSASGARGLMQVMPATGQRIAEQRGIENFDESMLSDPATNIDFGAWYLAQQLKRFNDRNGDALPLALSAYNAGPQAVADFLEGKADLPEETVRYRDALLALLTEAKAPRSATLEQHLKRVRRRLSAGFVRPAPGRVTHPFASRQDPLERGDDYAHRGVDIASDEGSDVQAALAGRILATGSDDQRGNFVVIRHANGVESSYHHLASVGVENGQWVKAGEVLGALGDTGRSTGPHVHFEMTEYGNPVDPSEYGFRATQSGYGIRPTP